MCSFLVTNKKISDNVNFYLQKRGPDKTTTCTVDNINFIHNLLSITGDLTTQPISDNNIFLVFNGEIYNYDEKESYSSDGYYILDCYKNYGDKFISYLDGEFALVLVDFNKQKVYFSGDIFLTKPIYASIENNEFGISSYKSALQRLSFKNIKRLIPNNYYSFSLKDYKVEYKGVIYDFNLDQKIDSFDLWTEAFINSLKKRTKNTRGNIVVPMSSGHDSGSIVCGLNKIGFNNFITYSFVGLEDIGVVEGRLKNIRNIKQYIENNVTANEVNEIKKLFEETVEPFDYGYNESSITHKGFDDIGAVGLYKILKTVKNDFNVKVQLSGQGGDEITGNVQTYGFCGKWNPKIFPENLHDVFPWANFYYGCNYSYLQKEECIAGSLGIETRYPLLDKVVVQQFLNLTSKLKNSMYKAPLTNFMTANKFPYLNGKLGFNLLVN
jgi:asparagine synthetase B (glutamine-hydrolysing)